MNTASTHDVTRLLQAWSEGQPGASDQLLPIIYEHLRRIAHEHFKRERPDHTLQPTILVHEAYLHLTHGASVQWQGRAHFFNLAARAMRRLLVDHARGRGAQKRGGQQRRVPLESAGVGELIQPEARAGLDFVALDGALGKLAAAYPRPGRVVELRFFGGLEASEIAGILEVSESTVKRDWQVAKLWLLRELDHDTNLLEPF